MAGDARNILDSTEEVHKRVGKRWWLTATAGAEYEDNLTVEEEEKFTDEEDIAAVIELEAGYKFPVPTPFEAEVSYDFYQSLFADLSEYNLHSHTLGLSGSAELGKWDLGLDYYFTYMLLGGDPFWQTHRVIPSAGFMPWSNLYARVSYILWAKDFLEKENEPRDGVNHSVGVDVFLFFMDYRAYVRATYRLDGEDTSGDEFDYLGQILGFALKLPLPFETTFYCSYKYHFRDYGDITPSIGTEREDHRHALEFALKKTLFDGFELKVNYQYNNNDSNLPSADYHENIVFVGASYSL
jgi:hypothetical protein